MNKQSALKTTLLVILFFVLSFYFSINTHAATSGTLESVPANHALVGIGYGSDDEDCTLWIQQGKLNANGRITNLKIKQINCEWPKDDIEPGDDSWNSNRRKTAPTDHYITGWAWDASTSGGSVWKWTRQDSGNPDNECHYQAYREFDPVTKKLSPIAKEFGSPKDGSCNERGYWWETDDEEKNNLQRVLYADIGYVITGIGLSLGDDADVDRIYIAEEGLGQATVAIRGKVYNASTGQGFGGVTVKSCFGDPVETTTHANGTFSFQMLAGEAFCVRVDPRDRDGFNGPFVKDQPPTKKSYEQQWAATHVLNNYDRAVDTGYDFEYYPVDQPTPTSPHDAECISITAPISVNAESSFVGTVKMKNVGTNTWTQSDSYKLGSQNPQNNTRWGFNRLGLPVSSVATDEIVTFTLNATAPATPGIHAFDWKMLQESVEWFGDTCRKNITVNDVEPPIPDTNDSQCLSITAPDTVDPGESFNATVEMKNTGTKTWDKTDATPHLLGSTNPTRNVRWGINLLDLPSDTIDPDQTATFNLSATAPTDPSTDTECTKVGENYTCPFNWKMLEESIEWFGDTCLKDMTIETAIPATLSVDLTATSPINDGDFSLLTSTVTGTATGPISYYIWFDCDNPTTDVPTAEAVCGSLPSPVTPGTCETDTNGLRCNQVNDNPGLVSHQYDHRSTPYVPKVIAERDTADNAEDRAQVVVNQPNDSPTVTIATLVNPDYCSSGPAITVNWDYSDPESDPQEYYRVHIDTDSSFPAPVDFTSGKVQSSSVSYFQSSLNFNTTYYVRVRVWDDQGNMSAWGPTRAFTTPAHSAPSPDFSWLPTDPATETEIFFADETTGGQPPFTYNWDFDCVGGVECDTPFSIDRNPINIFHVDKTYSVELRVTDPTLPITCSETKNFSMGAAKEIPEWKEVGPLE